MSTPKTAFDDTLGRLLDERATTRLLVAEAMGVSPSTLNNLIWNAKRGPTSETVERLAAALELDDEQKAELALAAGYVPREIVEEILRDPALARCALRLTRVQRSLLGQVERYLERAARRRRHARMAPEGQGK